ncbi:type III secretion system chaperone [Pseudomonas fontis]|uniref:Type III secretion system chaperone n=1 Tax=Pseudomonas fontis TaxID=2942633 RepID=A0ABT5NT26_9PSED|nr:type III secretion system chaperone [Pseudomonas fontis]MDD0975124.1 type III secretion system chaperone [Pseudomonas fontis]MDD0991334.1 type III secretion system chaperone [Pseudomonas fontis]
MSNPSTTLERYITRLGNQLGTTLSFQHGVCALYDRDGHQAVVIEVPEHADQLILHCRLGALQPGPDQPEQLLRMNFAIAALRGCWLALDQGDIRLCTQREMSILDDEGFCSLVNGYIAQVRETRTQLRSFLA